MFPQQNNQNAEQPNNPEAQLGGRSKKEQPKKPKESFALRPQHFESKKGLQALYERTLNLNLDENSEINVEGTMKRIVMLLKSWHFEMTPKYSFQYFLQRCQVLGTGKQLSAYMSKIRKIHKGLDTWQEANPEREVQPNNEGGVPSRMQEEGKQAMEMMNRYTAGAEVGPVEMDEQDREWMELMREVDKKQNEKKENQKKQQEQLNQEQPYVPQGFQFDFSESEN